MRRIQDSESRLDGWHMRTNTEAVADAIFITFRHIT